MGLVPKAAVDVDENRMQRFAMTAAGWQATVVVDCSVCFPALFNE
jgi:hypothetical protein